MNAQSAHPATTAVPPASPPPPTSAEKVISAAAVVLSPLLMTVAAARSKLAILGRPVSKILTPPSTTSVLPVTTVLRVLTLRCSVLRVPTRRPLVWYQQMTAHHAVAVSTVLSMVLCPPLASVFLATTALPARPTPATTPTCSVPTPLCVRLAAPSPLSVLVGTIRTRLAERLASFAPLASLALWVPLSLPCCALLASSAFLVATAALTATTVPMACLLVLLARQSARLVLAASSARMV